MNLDTIKSLVRPTLAVMSQRRNAYILRLLVGLALLAVLVIKSDFEALAGVLANMDFTWLALAFIVQTASIIVWGARWAALMRAYRVEARPHRTIPALYVGMFFNSFLPSSVGGDVYRAHWVLENRSQFRMSVFLVFVERFIGFLTLAYLTLLVLIFLFSQGLGVGEIHIPAMIALVLLCAGVFLLNSANLERLNRLLLKAGIRLMGKTREKVIEAVGFFGSSGRTRWVVIVHSILIQLAGIALYYCVSRAVGIPLDFWHYCLIVPPTVTAAMLLPISFNGLGVREMSLLAFSSAIGVTLDPSSVVVLGLSVLCINLASSVIGAIFYFADLSHRDPVTPFSTTGEKA